MREVHADLMGPPCLELNPNERVPAKASHHAVMRHCRPAVGPHCHSSALTAMPSNGLVNRSAPRHDPGAHCQVVPADLAPSQRCDQRGMCFGSSGDDQQAARVLVQAVHDPCPGNHGKRRIEAQERVLQRMAGVAGAGVHHQSRRLIDHEQGLVPEDDLQRQGFRGNLPVGLEPGVDVHPLAAEHFVLAAQAAPVDLHLAGLDPALQPRPRILRQRPGKRLVEPQPRQLRGQLQLMGAELPARICGRKSCRRIRYTGWNYPARSQRKVPP